MKDNKIMMEEPSKTIIPQPINSVGPAQNKQEKLAATMEILEIPTPKVLEAIEELRLSAAADPEDAFFLAIPNVNKTKEQLHKEAEEMFGEGKFVILCWNGDEPMGVCRAEKHEVRGEGVWYIGSDYMKKNFRGHGFGQKMLATRLDEIRKRGGIKAVGIVKKINTRRMHIARKFNFKAVAQNKSGEGYVIETDLTDSEVISKINEALNAG
jgi:hypothetical protein